MCCFVQNKWNCHTGNDRRINLIFKKRAALHFVMYGHSLNVRIHSLCRGYQEETIGIYRSSAFVCYRYANAILASFVWLNHLAWRKQVIYRSCRYCKICHPAQTIIILLFNDASRYCRRPSRIFNNSICCYHIIIIISQNSQRLLNMHTAQFAVRSYFKFLWDSHQLVSCEIVR